MCDEALTARYANGSTQTLTAEPYQIYDKEIKDGGITEYHKDGRDTSLYIQFVRYKCHQ